jgi:hypothetical protein
VRAGDRPEDDGAGSAKNVWLKYGLALLLAAAAFAAGVLGAAPWPESGLVSGLILMGTGPLFALKLAALEQTQPKLRRDANCYRRLPWFTATAGLIETAVVLVIAISNS